MNKVKRSKQIEIIMEGLPLKKFAWICVACKTEYALRSDAQRCLHKDYIEVEGLGKRWVNKIDGSIEYLSRDIEYLKELKVMHKDVCTKIMEI